MRQEGVRRTAQRQVEWQAKVDSIDVFLGVHLAVDRQLNTGRSR
jgi:hypothetical protein